MDDFKFSIVVAIYNSAKYLDDTITSVINQDIGFKENVQLILVNDGSTDNSMDIISKYYQDFPDNIITLSKENGGPASARNLGLKYATGEFVNFLDGDDMLALNALSRVYDFFSINKDIDVASIPLMLFGNINGNHHLNYKFEKERVVDLREEYNFPQLSVASSFIKRAAILNNSFNERLINAEDVVFVNEILLEKQKIGFLNSTEYKYRKHLDSYSLIDNPFDSKRAFTEKMELCYKHLIDYSIRKFTYVPKFIQYLIALDLKDIINSDQFEQVITDENDIAEFWDCLNYILKYIDDDIIQNHKYLNKEFKRVYMYFKHRDVNIKLYPKKHKAFIKSGGYLLDRFEWHKLFLDIVEVRNNALNISGSFSGKFYPDTIDIQAIIKTPEGKKEIFDCKKVEYPTTERKTKKYLGIEWSFFYNFDLEIPLDKYSNFKVTFRYVLNEKGRKVTAYPEIRFRSHCNLSMYSNYSVKDSKIILFKDNAIHLVNCSSKFRIKLELKSMLKIMKSSEKMKLNSLAIRLLYFVRRKHYKDKRIWLFMDRPTIADDNARHLFNYAVNQNDDILKYFILDKNSDDFNDMKKISSNIVPYGSLKHKILYLFSEKIISSHVDDFWLDPFFYSNRKLYSGFTTIEKCFLQHGVIKDDISYWIKKYQMNLFLFLTSSDYERDSILNGFYNFPDNVVKSLGLPRFDNLNEGSKKQILFIPTWRNYLNNKDKFINSEYFKNLNSFFNNKKLLELIKNQGYELIFKPHYNLLPYVDYFNIPSEIIVSDDSFQTLFNNSSLLITDYSSVGFDFAYVKKPVIYFQHDDFHYPKGYFDYETMAFGDVVKSEEDLVEKISEYLENGCIMEDKFKERVVDFFKFLDKSNCKRVYNWLYENK